MERRGSDDRCSFCGRYQHRVKRLIAGQGAFICDECVATCSQVMSVDEAHGKQGNWVARTEGRGRKPRAVVYGPLPDGFQPKSGWQGQ
jgi:ATP-dependent Clp protease ATP-binding subunit ClpX